MDFTVNLFESVQGRYGKIVHGRSPCFLSFTRVQATVMGPKQGLVEKDMQGLCISGILSELGQSSVASVSMCYNPSPLSM